MPAVSKRKQTCKGASVASAMTSTNAMQYQSYRILIMRTYAEWLLHVMAVTMHNYDTKTQTMPTFAHLIINSSKIIIFLN
jgi:hypothetical protein